MHNVAKMGNTFSHRKDPLLDMVTIAIYIVLALTGLGLLAMVLFGARSLAYGKVDPISAAIVFIPVLLLVILGFIMPTWAQAAIWTVIIMFGIAVLSLLFTGVGGIFK